MNKCCSKLTLIVLDFHTSHIQSKKATQTIVLPETCLMTKFAAPDQEEWTMACTSSPTSHCSKSMHACITQILPPLSATLQQTRFKLTHHHTPPHTSPPFHRLTHPPTPANLLQSLPLSLFPPRTLRHPPKHSL